MRRFLMMLLGSVALMVPVGCGDAAPPAEMAELASEGADVSATDANNQFAGAWRLVSIERRDADGELVAPLIEDRLGYIIYDASGHMGVTLMQPTGPYSRGTSRRRKRRSPRCQPTRRTSGRLPSTRLKGS